MTWFCLLDVPTHKTGTAFTKPVGPLLGQAIEAWQAVRPDQPKLLDRKTSERVDFLFAVRAKRVAKHYINEKIIPVLCAKAGVPAADVRGKITSHRARSTIASQLYNAKEPMTLFELQAWLGHASPETTQHYAKITPNTLTRAYKDAGYFERNVRTIEVLIDRDAVASGQAEAGEPWQHYDLGHGLCSYTFFEQCQHRMACAKCDFYIPKNSSKAQLLEAKANLQRMLIAIPLTDDEKAAVDDGQEALDKLLERLADTPTPDGSTPRQLACGAAETPLLPARRPDRRRHRRTPRKSGGRLTWPQIPHNGREVAAGIHRSAEPGVNRLDCVGGADDRPYFPVEPQERHEFGPRVLPQPYNGRVALLPLAGELGEPVERLGFRRGGVDRLEVWSFAICAQSFFDAYLNEFRSK